MMIGRPHTVVNLVELFDKLVFYVTDPGLGIRAAFPWCLDLTYRRLWLILETGGQTGARLRPSRNPWSGALIASLAICAPDGLPSVPD